MYINEDMMTEFSLRNKILLLHSLEIGVFDY